MHFNQTLNTILSLSENIPTTIATEIYEMEHFKIPFWNALEWNRAQFVVFFFRYENYKKTQRWRVHVASFWKEEAPELFNNDWVQQ